MANGTDAYYDMLFGPEAGASMGGTPQSGLGGVQSGMAGALNSNSLKGAGAGIFLSWALSKLLQSKHQRGMRNIQLQNLRDQAEMVTPQNLYYQAALPEVKEDEKMASNALLSHLSGGVLGPTLAKGEYLIGG